MVKKKNKEKKVKHRVLFDHSKERAEFKKTGEKVKGEIYIPIKQEQLIYKLENGNKNFTRYSLKGLYLPRAELNHSNFSITDLRKAILHHGDLSYSTFDRANLEEINLKGTDLTHSTFIGTNLRKADIEGTDISHACFDQADIRGIIGLEKCMNLKYATFRDTIVSEREAEIILRFYKPFNIVTKLKRQN